MLYVLLSCKTIQNVYQVQSTAARLLIGASCVDYNSSATINLVVTSLVLNTIQRNGYNL